MDDAMITTHLNNLDRRLENIEQILQQEVAPRLANVEKRLGNVEQGLGAIEQALPSLATRDEMRAEAEQSRRHMDVIGESLRTDIQLLAEHLSGVMSRRSDV